MAIYDFRKSKDDPLMDMIMQATMSNIQHKKKKKLTQFAHDLNIDQIEAQDRLARERGAKGHEYTMAQIDQRNTNALGQIDYADTVGAKRVASDIDSQTPAFYIDPVSQGRITIGNYGTLTPEEQVNYRPIMAPYGTAPADPYIGKVTSGTGGSGSGSTSGAMKKISADSMFPDPIIEEGEIVGYKDGTGYFSDWQMDAMIDTGMTRAVAERTFAYAAVTDNPQKAANYAFAELMGKPKLYKNYDRKFHDLNEWMHKPAAEGNKGKKFVNKDWNRDNWQYLEGAAKRSGRPELYRFLYDSEYRNILGIPTAKDVADTQEKMKDLYGKQE